MPRCISGISVASLGHSHPGSLGRRNRRRLICTPCMWRACAGPPVRLARAITQASGCGVEAGYFVTSGSEAIEAALKLAKRATGRRQTISFKGAYHGSSHGALSLMGDQHFSNGYLPLVPGNTVLGYNDIQGIQRIGAEHAAVVVEVIQSESGYCPANEQFLLTLQERCRAVGALLILDEIQTGFGRSGPLFAFQDTVLQPDMVAMAKAMGGGMPLGGIAASKKLMDHFTEHPVLGHITTFMAIQELCMSWPPLAARKRSTRVVLRRRERAEGAIGRYSATISVESERCRPAPGKLKTHVGQRPKGLGKGLLIDWFLYNEAAFA